MSRGISVVDLSSGVITEAAPDSATLDAPAGAGPDVTEIFVDGIGAVHFVDARGAEQVAQGAVRPLSARDRHDTCFVWAVETRDARGWAVFRYSVVAE